MDINFLKISILILFPYCSYLETGIFYSKPRAIVQADTLSWKNLPTVPRQHLPQEFLREFSKSELLAYENYGQTPVLRPPFLGYSKLLDCFWRLSLYTEPPTDTLEVQRLAKKLITTWREEASKEGSGTARTRTVVVHDVGWRWCFHVRGCVRPERAEFPSLASL